MSNCCRVCGEASDTRMGVCFDCASNAERIAAKRSPDEHFAKAKEHLANGDFESARIAHAWAWERLTGTGDYAPGGTFDAEYPGWRDD